MTSSKQLSFLDLVKICDGIPTDQSDAEVLVPFVLDLSSNGPVIGYLRRPVVQQLCHEVERSQENNPWAIQRDDEGSIIRIGFQSWLSTPTLRTKAMKELCERWRDSGIFESSIGPKMWRGELYPVYRNPFGVHDRVMDADEAGNTNLVFEMERASCPIFGFPSYGVYMTVYDEESMRIWVPTRAQNKRKWPGYHDNTVAGGISSGLKILEALVKESDEEASIGEAVVRKHAKAVGAISYIACLAGGWRQPKIAYTYDLPIPRGADAESFRPKPKDGSVALFELLPVDQVISKMRMALFMPNTALVLIDFLIRHGYLTPDNEPDYMEIITRLHTRINT